MRYKSGQIAQVGDRVRLWGNKLGSVVCSFDDRKFSVKFSEEDWGDYTKGILIEDDEGEIFMYEGQEDNLELAEKTSSF